MGSIDSVIQAMQTSLASLDEDIRNMESTRDRAVSALEELTRERAAVVTALEALNGTTTTTPATKVVESVREAASPVERKPRRKGKNPGREAVRSRAKYGSSRERAAKVLADPSFRNREFKGTDTRVLFGWTNKDRSKSGYLMDYMLKEGLIEHVRTEDGQGPHPQKVYRLTGKDLPAESEYVPSEPTETRRFF